MNENKILTPKQKGNLKYNQKCTSKSIQFRNDVDGDLIEYIKNEKVNFNALVKALLREHIVKENSK